MPFINEVPATEKSETYAKYYRNLYYMFMFRLFTEVLIILSETTKCCCRNFFLFLNSVSNPYSSKKIMKIPSQILKRKKKKKNSQQRKLAKIKYVPLHRDISSPLLHPNFFLQKLTRIYANQLQHPCKWRTLLQHSAKSAARLTPSEPRTRS